MIGPVLAFELTRTSRRGWHHRLAWIYAGWLVFLIGVNMLLETAAQRQQLELAPLSPDFLAHVSRQITLALIGQQDVLLLLIAPAFAAGSICDEKTRRTLQEWLTTDLSAWEILRDKLLAQLVQIGTLALVGLPLVVFFGLFAGLELLDLAMLQLTLLFQLLAISAASLLAAVWCKRTTSAVLAVYGWGATAFALAYLADLHHYFHPQYLLNPDGFGPAWLGPRAGALGMRLVCAGLAWGSVTALCLGLAVWQLRPAYLRQLASEAVRPGHFGATAWRPPVGNQPLRWKERYLGELPALAVLRRLPRWFAVEAVALQTTAACVFILAAHLSPFDGLLQVIQLIQAVDFYRLATVWARSSPADFAFLMLGVAAALVFSLTVGIRCANVISSERERQTWDLLLTTPLEPRQILRGKLWGVIDSTRPYLLAYLVPAAAFACLGGILALVWVLFWWLATWLMMYYMGATGVGCSVRSFNSWRSLLATLLSNAWVIFIRYVMLGAPIGLIVTGIVVTLCHRYLSHWGSPSAMFVVIYLVVSVGLTLIFLFAEAEYQLMQAERWIWRHERIPPVGARVLKSPGVKLWR